LYSQKALLMKLYDQEILKHFKIQQNGFTPEFTAEITPEVISSADSADEIITGAYGDP